MIATVELPPSATSLPLVKTSGHDNYCRIGDQSSTNTALTDPLAHDADLGDQTRGWRIILSSCMQSGADYLVGPELPESDASTQPIPVEPEYLLRAEVLLNAASDETFEDGFESPFSRNLIRFVEVSGNRGLRALAHLIITQQIGAVLAGETLMLLGGLEDPRTYFARLDLLEHALSHPSRYVRDGAALGLADLANPHAVPFLRRAIEKEQMHLLRRNLLQVLHHLKSR
jgi:hypothetical protein